MNKSIYIKTLGCKVNSYDGNALVNQLTSRGFHQVDKNDNASVSIINSCSVTANAEKEARYLARRIKRNNPNSKVIVTGCYAQINSSELSKLDYIDFIIPNEVKDKAAEIIEKSYDQLMSNSLANKLPEDVKPVTNNRQTHFKSAVTIFDEAHSTQTRAFLKVQDGCNNFCTYCLIPYARGASRSVPPQDVLDEVTRLGKLGTKEIVFTGIHIGDYGEDLTATKHANLSKLLEGCLIAAPNTRFRISSLEPHELTSELVELMAINKTRFCHHFHLPIQSGNNRILKLMRRHYTREEFQAGVEMIRRHFPLANIGTDIIPGFPGETNDEFNDGYQFIESLKLSYLHVFPYSKRPNTAAARMGDHLPFETIKERAAKLRKLSDKLQNSYGMSFINTTTEVIWEHNLDSSGRRKGLSQNYLNVVAPLKDDFTTQGSLSQVMIKGMIDPSTFLAVPSLSSH